MKNKMSDDGPYKILFFGDSTCVGAGRLNL